VSRKIEISALLAIALFGTACSTVKVPDIVDLPEFREEAANVENLEYPDPAQAPSAPSDIRSAEQWDTSAKALIQKRESINVPPESPDALTDPEIIQEIDALKNKVKEYKVDDPIEF